MKKSVLFDGLRIERFVKPLEQDLSFEGLSCYHVKETYDSVWCDFTDDEVEEAITHAKQEIELANIVNDHERRNHLKRACKDLSNYLIVTSNLRQKYSRVISFGIDDNTFQKWKRDAKRLIKSLAYYHDDYVDEWVSDAILQRYQAEDIRYEEYAFFPYYEDLFCELGDIALFLQCDVHRALIWYRLAGFDWYDILEKSDQKLDKDDQRKKNRLLWWKNIIDVVDIFVESTDDSIQHTHYINYCNRLTYVTDNFRELLQNYLNAWGNYDINDDERDEKSIKDAIEKLLEQTKIDINKDGQPSETLRTELLIANVLRNQSLYYQLKTISDEKGIDKENEESIIKLINSSDEEKLDIVKNYLKVTLLTSTHEKVMGTMRLIKAISLCDRILSVLNIRVPNGHISYYTGYQTLGKMLPDTSDGKDNIGKLSVMHVAYMNDPNEGKLLGYWIFGKKETGIREKANYPFVFLKCFTTRIDDLPMWEMYGDHAEGCCIVFNMQQLMSSNSGFFPIYNVCYICQEDGKYSIKEENNNEINSVGIQKLQEYIEGLVKIAGYSGDEAYRKAFSEIIGNISYLFKHSDYSYECEKRIFYSVRNGLDKRIRRTKTDTPMLYYLSNMSLRIEELILGPKFKDAYLRMPYLQQRLDQMRDEIGDDRGIPITYSSIEYK